jgi:hypothetical protein
LNALFEAQTVAKKELRAFQPVVQTAYLQMHQVETLVDEEWNSLITSNPKEFNTSATQQFVAEASLLARKWQDKIEHFQEIRKKSLELVPELGPCLKDPRKKQLESWMEAIRRRNQIHRRITGQTRDHGRTKDLTGVSQGLWLGPIGPFVLINRSCHKLPQKPENQAKEGK